MIASLRSVRTRIVAFFAILIVLVQGSAFLLVNAANSDNARRVTDSELATGERIVQRALDDDRHGFLQRALAFAEDSALRASINAGKRSSIARVLEGDRRVLDASSVQLLSDEGIVVANSGSGEGDAAFRYPQLLEEARRNGEANRLALIESQLHHMALVPVASSPVTWLAIARPVSDGWLRNVAHVAALDVSFAARNGDSWIVATSTLSPEGRDSLGKRISTVNGARDVRAQLALEGRDFQSRLFDIDTAPRHEVVAVLQRPLGDALALFDQLRTLLMGLAAVSLSGTLIGSIFIARGITGPLAKLAKSAARISRGDYSPTIDISTRDEIGALADALNRMREGIASHEQEILRLAYEDRVTGLPNRALFNDRLAGAVNLARRTGQPLTVMLMDLDRFKHINDTLGHSVGDYVLHEVGTRLRGALRESDTIARLGGDEFGMLLPTGNEERISEVVRKILRCIEQPIECEGQCLDVGASIGIARFPEHGDKPDTLISRADVAMYLAKAANSEFAYYDANHHGAHQEQLSLLGELRRAVERNELRVYFQPKIDLRSGQTKGVEALVRWMHPSRGIVPPIEFMPFAERTGFVRTVTRFVLETALTRCGEWLEQGMRLQVSVNISVRDLQNTDLPDIVEALLSKCAVPPELVCLEITESSFMENPQRALQTLGRLRALGIRLSIDDFGTGFSSLAYLRKLRVHEIKVDRTFIAAMEEGDDMVIVRSTVELAHNLGLTVVAEGIEDERSLARLRAMGCDEAQGFFMSRPLPEDRLIEWLKTSPYGLERPGERALPLLRYA